MTDDYPEERPDQRAVVDMNIGRVFSIPMHVMGREQPRLCGACSMPFWWHDEQQRRDCRRRFEHPLRSRAWNVQVTRPGSDVEREDRGHPANRCQVCHEQPSWDLRRQGDAVVSWACSPHLADVLIDLQRENERTQITVTFLWEAA